MHRIEVLGPGCTRCKEAFRVVSHVVETERLPFTVEKVEAMERMIEGYLAFARGEGTEQAKQTRG